MPMAINYQMYQPLADLSDLWMLAWAQWGSFMEITEQNPSMSFLPCNFNSPVPIPDQDNDGIVDFITVQGGLRIKHHIFKLLILIQIK